MRFCSGVWLDCGPGCDFDKPATPCSVNSRRHHALQTGDKELARAQLASDVMIYEGGRVERSADEYAHHHMLSDMKYLAAMKSETLEHQVTILGNTAISASRSHTKGTYKGKERNYQGMETTVFFNRVVQKICSKQPLYCA